MAEHHLAWVRDFAMKPMAQLWPTGRASDFDKDRTIVVFPIKTEHAELPLDDLARLYPLPEAVGP